MNIKDNPSGSSLGCPINWDYVDKKWNVLAVDRNGDIFFYEAMPKWDTDEEVWFDEHQTGDILEVFPDFLRGDFDTSNAQELIWTRPGWEPPVKTSPDEHDDPEEEVVEQPDTSLELAFKDLKESIDQLASVVNYHITLARQ